MSKVEKRVKFWPRSVQDELYNLHEDAREAFFQALQDAKLGLTSSMAKAHGEDDRLRGVMKISKNASDGNTYRGIYTVEFDEAIWVIDVYDKQSKSGISTPKLDLDRTAGRLVALKDYRATPEGKKEIADLLADRAKRQEQQDRKVERFHVVSVRHAKRT